MDNPRIIYGVFLNNYGISPIRKYNLRPEWGVDGWWAGKNFDIDKMGLNDKLEEYGWLTFSSTKKSDVELFYRGVKSVMRILKQLST